MGDAFIGAEIQRQLEESLARFGTAGQVHVASGLATLSGYGPTVQVDVASLEAQWDTLTAEHRARRVNDVARRLATERRTLSQGPASTSGWDVPPWLAPLGGVLLVLLIGFGAWLAYRQWQPAAAAKAKAKAPVVSDYDAYERERTERAARVCDATRSRIVRGATVGPSEVEGWVVELWLLRSRGAQGAGALAEPALSPFLKRGSDLAPHVPEGHHRIVWAGTPILTAQEGPDTRVTVEAGDLGAADQDQDPRPAWQGLRLVASGRYVVPYFDEAGRLEHLKLARALAEAWSAEHGALYARCATGSDHHVGSWFRGPTAGGAASALTFFMGAFGEPPTVRQTLLAPEGATEVRLDFAFDGIRRATGPLKKTRIMALVGAEGGMIAGSDTSSSTITFPFRDANRATRAAQSVARDLGIGTAP